MFSKVSNITAWILIAIVLIAIAFLMAYPRNVGAAGVDIYWTGPTNPAAGTSQTYRFKVVNNTTSPVTFTSYPQCGFPANNNYCSGVPGQTVTTIPVGATVEIPFTFTVLNPGGTFQVYGFYKVNAQTRWLSKYVNVTPVSNATTTKRTYIPILEK